MKPLFLFFRTLVVVAILTGCTTSTSTSRSTSKRASTILRYENAPHILNVSSYDPKEKQRAGEAFSADNLSAMRRNGALGLIARSSKGLVLDKKAPRFLAAADREGMLLGAYHFLLPKIDPVTQANLFVQQVRQIAHTQRLRTSKILMVGDFDAKTRCRDMVRFILRIRHLTGRYPVVYLENSDSLKSELRHADPKTRHLLRQCPYWMALYSHVDSGKSRYSGHLPLTPQRLLACYRVWDTWALWQYGGVHWDARRRRSVPYHYNHFPFHSPRYFGNLDRPTERSVFNGSQAELSAFWQENAWTWK